MKWDWIKSRTIIVGIIGILGLVGAVIEEKMSIPQAIAAALPMVQVIYLRLGVKNDVANGNGNGGAK